MKDRAQTLSTKQDLQAVADDVKIIKAALTDTNQQVADHEQRITQLEQAA